MCILPAARRLRKSLRGPAPADAGVLMRRPVPARVLVALLAVAAAGCSGARPAQNVDARLSVGIEMAQRGLWNEALFRFEQAGRNHPGDVRVLNNRAVAYEATGRFDDALKTYRAALEASPDNRRLRQNYTRFVEFYQAFRPPKPQEEQAGEGSGEEGGRS